jgi:hypothetical protein
MLQPIAKVRPHATTSRRQPGFLPRVLRLDRPDKRLSHDASGVGASMTDPTRTRVLAMLSPLPHRRMIERFTIALGTAALAILLRALLDRVLGHVAF